MTLNDFLTKHQIKPTDFAETIGLKAPKSIYRYLSGIRVPRRSIMKKIVTATKGKVQPNDFY
jgi:hypothetical protein